MTRKSKAMPGIGQYLLGFILGSLAITAGSISLAMNYAYGIQTSAFMAAAFVVSDCAKMILPMTSAALGGWDHTRRAGYAVTLIMSIMAAASYLLESQSSRLIEAQSATRIVSAAQHDAERIREELDGISERRNPDAIHAEIEAHQQHKRWTSTKGCTDATVTPSRIYCQEHGKLKAALAMAERRAELLQQLAATRQTVTQTKVTAVGAATNLAALTGADRDQIAAHEAMLKSIFMLIVLELIAALSGAAGNIVTSTWQARKAKPKVKTPKADEKQTEANEISSKKSAPSYWMKRLSKERPDIASRVIAGEISCYKGCIEAGIRKAPAKTRKKSVAKWTKIDSYVQPVEA